MIAVTKYSFGLGLEPRKQRNESVDMLVDLAATQEDHPQVCLTLFLFSAFLRPKDRLVMKKT